jgi:tetratricopeptide (TPR) repeat protein
MLKRVANTALCWLLALLGVVTVLVTTVPAAGQLDPELKKPYELHVILHFAEHRALTRLFRDQVEQQLLGHLQLTFGKLADIKILRTHKLLDAVRVNGLQQTLDGWSELTGIKTHFVLIDFVNGRYEIQARQHDGITGLSSPVVRRDATSDARLVARKAAVLVDRDFGLAGTVVGKEGDSVNVAIHGGGLGVPLDRWLKADDIFAVARITGEANKQGSTRLDWTILKVSDKPKDGMCRCQFVTRFQENELIEGKNVLGYRCLRLATTSAPLRLRLLELENDDKAIIPLPGVQVHVSRKGFDDPEHLKLTSGPDGLVTTDEAFSNVAFVSVQGGVRARFPVEIVDDRTIVCRLRANPEADAQEQLDLRKGRWEQRIYDLHAAAAERMGSIEKQLQSDRTAALRNARDGVTSLQKEFESLENERVNLVEAADKTTSGKFDTTAGDQGLEQLRRDRAILAGTATNIEKVLAEENSEQRKALRSIVERAGLLESQADYEEAIKLYRQVLLQSPKEPKVKEYVENLEKAWRIMDNPDQQQFRDFVYNDWARPLDIAGIKEGLPRARRALEVFKKAGDRLSTRKLALADPRHKASLAKRLDALKHQRFSEDAINEIRTIRALNDSLAQLLKDANSYLRQGGKSGS